MYHIAVTSWIYYHTNAASNWHATFMFCNLFAHVLKSQAWCVRHQNSASSELLASSGMAFRLQQQVLKPSIVFLRKRHGRSVRVLCSPSREVRRASARFTTFALQEANMAFMMPDHIHSIQNKMDRSCPACLTAECVLRLVDEHLVVKRQCIVILHFTIPHFMHGSESVTIAGLHCNALIVRRMVSSGRRLIHS